MSQNDEPSGPEWVSRYPTSRELEHLSTPFQASVRRFLSELTRAGAAVRITSTRRPAERAYLMHFAFHIAHGLDPAAVPRMPGVPIAWTHPSKSAAQEAARRMVAAYGIVYAPALHSRHEEGNAIDMSVQWNCPLSLADSHGASVNLPSGGSGMTRALWTVGESYGVFKNHADPPHWSVDGH